MKGALPWLVRWALHAGTRDFYPALAALVSPVQNIFPHHTLFEFICPHRPEPGQGSRAGPPVSECESPPLPLYSLSSSNVYQLITLSPILRWNS